MLNPRLSDDVGMRLWRKSRVEKVFPSETFRAMSCHKKEMKIGTSGVGAGLAPAQYPARMPNTARATARVAPTNRIETIHR
jgi:hypothetical protein